MTETNPILEKALGLAKRSSAQGILVTHLTVRQSITILVLKLILIDIITAVVFLFSHSILFNTNVSSSLSINQNAYNTAIFLFLIFAKISLTIYLVFEWLNEYYEIRPNSIIYKKGIIFRKIKRQDLVLIRAAKVERGLFARVLNYGSINLYDIRLNQEMKLYLIHNPIKYLHVLESIIPDLEEEKEFFAREKVLENSQEE